MASIIVANGASEGKQQFQLDYQGQRVAIKSYSHDEKCQTTNYKAQSTNETKTPLKETINLTTARYEVLETVAKHDGNIHDLSKSDMDFAKTLQGKKFGVQNNQFTLKSVKDAGNGRTIFELAADRNPREVSYVEIDFETEAEKNARLAKETAPKKESKANNTQKLTEKKATIQRIQENGIIQTVIEDLDEFGKPIRNWIDENLRKS